MPNRVTRGEILAGGISLDSAAGLVLPDGALTATATELNTAADLSANGGLPRVHKIAIATAPTGAEQDTGFALPAKALLLDVFLDVTTAEATGTTKTMNIGLLSSQSGGDADGFAIGVSVATIAMVRPGPAITVGASESYVSSFTRGPFLTAGVQIDGTDLDGDVGTYFEKPFATNSVVAKNVSFTAGSSNWVEFRGAIYLVYVELG